MNLSGLRPGDKVLLGLDGHWEEAGVLGVEKKDGNLTFTVTLPDPDSPPVVKHHRDLH